MTISKRYIEVEIDEGDKRKFHKLTPYDRAEIADALHKKMRIQLEKNLELSKATPEQLMAELERFDTEFPFRPIMRLHIATEAGQLDVFLRALRVIYGTVAESIVKQFSPDEDESYKLAEALCGLKALPPPTPPTDPTAEKKPDEDNSAYGEVEPVNPPKPAEDSYPT